MVDGAHVVRFAVHDKIPIKQRERVKGQQQVRHDGSNKGTYIDGKPSRSEAAGSCGLIALGFFFSA